MMIATLLLAASVASSASTPVEVARAEAEENVKSPAGRRYEGVVIGRVEEWLRPAIQKCLRDLPKE